MYAMYMGRVRKQLYIEAEQEKALKRRAKALGITEAEIVRDALDAALAPSYAPALPENLVALEEVLARAEQLASSGHATPRGARWRRDDLYAERERRLTRSR
jgi:hypothetical protein